MSLFFPHGLISGFLSAITAIIYLKIYENATMVDFSLIINPVFIAVASILGCLLMELGYLILYKTKKSNWKGVLNLLIILLSFISILAPITMTLPLEFDFPEMFPGLVIPMHFFPAMIFFGLQPFFETKRIA